VTKHRPSAPASRVYADQSWPGAPMHERQPTVVLIRLQALNTSRDTFDPGATHKDTDDCFDRHKGTSSRRAERSRRRELYAILGKIW